MGCLYGELVFLHFFILRVISFVNLYFLEVGVMNKENKKSTRDKKSQSYGIVRRVCSKTELPCDMLQGEFRLELRGRREVFVSGCKRIIKYSEDEMIISAKNFNARIQGKGLVCSSYHCSGIVIEGLIEDIRLECR